MALPIAAGISGFLATKTINTASFYAGDDRCPEIVAKAINKIKSSFVKLEQKSPFLFKSLVFFKNYLGPIAFLATALYVNSLVLAFLASGMTAAGAIGLIWEGYDLVRKIIKPRKTPGPEKLAEQFEQFAENFRKYRPQLVKENRLIPEAYHDDYVFSLFTCPITQWPIRHPVIDPTSNTVYEKAALISWISSYRSSPLTKKPLTAERLLPAPEIEKAINERLKLLNLEIN